MQPTIAFTTPVPGMIYLNGRFAGESGPERALLTPVSPYGALYAEYRPLASRQRPTAFKCVFSSGKLMPDSLSEAEGVSAIQWPGNILEIEISCPESYTEHFSLGALSCIMEYGSATRLIAGSLRITLPDRALKPELLRIGRIPVFMGNIEKGGQYIATLTEDLTMQTGFLAADRIDFSGDIIHATASLGDTVGHGRLEQWFADENGLQRLSSEPVWASGNPVWPETAEDTMIAAVEAALAELPEEADGYFAPSLGETSPLNAVSDICDLCLPMKYGSPSPHPCVGLLKIESDHFAKVTPLCYRARLAGSLQGPWQIDWISLE